MTTKYNIGDTVYILARRSPSGCVCPPPESPMAADCPIVECRVAQTNAAGVEGVYGLEWADAGESVGLPFSGRTIFPSAEALKDRVDRCQVPL